MKMLRYLKGSGINNNNIESTTLKRLVLMLLRGIHYHSKSDQRDIYIFSSFRSGSTWLAELLSKHKGYKLVNEPLSPYKYEIEKNIYPIEPAQVYFHTDENEKAIIGYLNRLASGSGLLSYRYDILSPSHNFITHRSIFKLLRVSPIVEYLCEGVDVEPLLLIRHPIASAYSKIKSGIIVKDRDKKILDDRWYRDNYLSTRQIELAYEIIVRNNDLERSILEWCFDNIPLLKFHRKHPNRSILLTYEELVLHPKEVIEKLSYRLELDRTGDIVKSIYMPSASAGSYSDSRAISAIENKDSRIDIINKWKNRIDQAQLEKLLEIVEIFRVDIYDDDVLPQEQYMLLGKKSWK